MDKQGAIQEIVKLMQQNRQNRATIQALSESFNLTTGEVMKELSRDYTKKRLNKTNNN